MAEVVEYPAHVTQRQRRPGRPRIHHESWTKVTVVLFDRQIRFLDSLAASIRAEQGEPVSRAQLIRALVDSVGESVAAESTPVDAATDGGVRRSMLARLGLVVQSKK